MLQLLLWLLPVVDVFAFKRIVAYYRSLGIRVPMSHAKLGMVERWIGYLPAGFVIGWFAGFWMAFLIAFVTLAIVGPIEFYLMYRGIRPWRFFRQRPPQLVAKIFLLEGYNAIGYYLLGALLGLLVNT